MTKRDVATLACRILSLYVFYSAIISLPGFAAIPMLLQQRQPGEPPYFIVISFVAPLVLTLTFAAILWNLGDRVAALMVPDDDAEPDGRVATPDLQEIAFSVIGLFLLVEAIPHIPYLLLYVRPSAAAEGASLWYKGIRLSDTGNIGVVATQLVLGFGLFFGARWLSESVNRVRERVRVS